MSDTETKRGRPRPQDVVERDEAVMTAVKASAEGSTKEELAESTGLEPSAVYLSLFRLRKDGRIERAEANGDGNGRTRRWIAVK